MYLHLPESNKVTSWIVLPLPVGIRNSLGLSGIIPAG
jgi:hypothetical protein